MNDEPKIDVLEPTKPKKKLVELKNTAYGLVQEASRHAENGDVIIGKWKLVAIKYDLDTGRIGDIGVAEMEDLGYALETVQVKLENEIAKLAKE